MKTRFLFTMLAILMLAILMYASAFAQPVIKNQWVAGGSLDDIFTCMDLTKDGGYILGGYSNSDISGNKTENTIGANDYWVVKLDNIGAIQWDKTIQASKDDKLYAI